jgi:apolipoprotein N-acyltransferase
MFHNICRELVSHGAEVLINITSDSWSGMESALTQHTASARFRAIETRTPLVRSTNAGLTGVIDPSGAITAGLPLFEPGYLLVDVPVPARPGFTLYGMLGDYLPFLFLGFLLWVCITGAFVKTRIRGAAFLRSRIHGLQKYGKK